MRKASVHLLPIWQIGSNERWKLQVNKKKCSGLVKQCSMLILSCCQSNSPKVGQTCSLNLNKENVVLHMQPADMPTMLFIVPNSKRSPAAAALFRASRGCRRRMERMRKWYYIKLARSAWGIRNKRIYIWGQGGEGPRETGRRCEIDLRRSRRRTKLICWTEVGSMSVKSEAIKKGGASGRDSWEVKLWF